MTHLTKLPRTLAFAAALAFAAPAIAAAPHGDAHGEQADHGKKGGHAKADSHGGDHAAEGDHGGDHGGGHHYYTADDDHDGTANWLDSDSDMYAVSDLAFHAIHLLIFIGLAVWLARKPMGDALANRAANIRKELTDSARARDEAYQRHQELVARLDKVASEIEAMEADAVSDAANEEQKLVERAQREATRIGEMAQRNIRDEATRARMALRRDAVELAVELAEGILTKSVNTSDQQALARDFLNSLSSDDQPSA